MNIEIFSLCDAATQSPGKLNILGAFDTIAASQFPAMHPQCSVALRIRFDRIEQGPHTLKISFVDLDGRPIIPSVNANIEVGFQGNEPTGAIDVVLNIQGLQFEKPCQYSIDLAIDGKRERSLPLYVIESKQQKPKPASPMLNLRKI